MRLAVDNNIQTIAFPSISTGAYGFPITPAARIAISTVAEALKRSHVVEKVIFVCFSSYDYNVYEQELRRLYPN